MNKWALGHMDSNSRLKALITELIYWLEDDTQEKFVILTKEKKITLTKELSLVTQFRGQG